MYSRTNRRIKRRRIEEKFFEILKYARKEQKKMVDRVLHKIIRENALIRRSLKSETSITLSPIELLFINVKK